MSTGDLLEREAHALEDLFNDAKASHSREIEWFAMGLDHDTGEQQFVLEAPRYIDGDGIAALREAGWEIQYIEAYHSELTGEIGVQIQVPVRGQVPDTGGADVA